MLTLWTPVLYDLSDYRSLRQPNQSQTGLSYLSCQRRNLCGDALHDEARDGRREKSMTSRPCALIPKGTPGPSPLASFPLTKVTIL